MPTSSRAAYGADRRPPLRRNRNYLLLWSGQAVSKVGSGISDITFPLLTLALTGSPAEAGFVGTALALPYLILGLPAGALIDRWDRKRVMVICDVGRAAALGSIPAVAAFGHITVVQLYAVAAASGTFLVGHLLCVWPFRWAKRDRHLSSLSLRILT